MSRKRSPLQASATASRLPSEGPLAAQPWPDAVLRSSRSSPPILQRDAGIPAALLFRRLDRDPLAARLSLDGLSANRLGPNSNGLNRRGPGLRRPGRSRMLRHRPRRQPSSVAGFTAGSIGFGAPSSHSSSSFGRQQGLLSAASSASTGTRHWNASSAP